MSRKIIVYMTAGTYEEAGKIARDLVSSRLVACVNIISGMHSCYWWEGEIKYESEAVLIAKTKDSLLSKVVERVKTLHSYDCPCIVSVPIAGGNSDFLDWIEKETV